MQFASPPCTSECVFEGGGWGVGIGQGHRMCAQALLRLSGSRDGAVGHEHSSTWQVTAVLPAGGLPPTEPRFGFGLELLLDLTYGLGPCRSLIHPVTSESDWHFVDRQLKPH